MAQVVLSATELVHLLRANALLPDQVTDVQANGREIKAKVKTHWPVPKSVRVSLRFAGFDHGHVILQLLTNRFLDKFSWVVDKMLDSSWLESQGGRWEYPRLYVDVNRLVEQRLRGVEITDVVFREGRYRITMTHRPHQGQDIDPARDESVDTTQLSTD